MGIQKNNFPATVIIVIILAGAIFLLSGLCTGGFAWQAEMGEPDAYSPRHWYEAVLIGAFALVPSGLMLWAAIRLVRRGNNKISGVIFLIAGALLGLYGLVTLLGFFVRVIDLILYGFSIYGMAYSLGTLAFAAMISFCAYSLLRVSITIFKNKSQPPINPETFD